MVQVFTVLGAILNLVSIFGLCLSFQLDGLAERRTLRIASLVIMAAITSITVLGGWEKELTSYRMFVRVKFAIVMVVLLGLSLKILCGAIYGWLTNPGVNDDRITRYIQGR